MYCNKVIGAIYYSFSLFKTMHTYVLFGLIQYDLLEVTVFKGCSTDM